MVILGLALIYVLLLLRESPEAIKSPEIFFKGEGKPPEEITGEILPGEILLVATGDIMAHKTMFPSAYNAAEDSYDFKEWFKPVEKYIREADIAIANLETTLSGEEMGYTGFPVFNTPEILAFNLKDAGFSIVSTANNHCLDRLEAGVIKTIEHLEEAGLAFTGTARSAEEREEIKMIEKNNIRAAFLAYTYGTNNIPIPEKKEYLVNMIDEELIKRDITRAREEGADIVAVSLHWGKEYSREPTEEQRVLAEKIISWGGDLILGSHPHVLQPVEFIIVGEGDETREGVVIYSLGNFIADQIMRHTDSGIILRLRYARDEQGEISLEEINCVPTWIHKYSHGGPRKFRVLPVQDAMKDYERGRDPLLRNYDYQRLQQVWDETTNHIWLSTYSR